MVGLHCTFTSTSNQKVDKTFIVVLSVGVCSLYAIRKVIKFTPKIFFNDTLYLKIKQPFTDWHKSSSPTRNPLLHALWQLLALRFHTTWQETSLIAPRALQWAAAAAEAGQSKPTSQLLSKSYQRWPGPRGQWPLQPWCTTGAWCVASAPWHRPRWAPERVESGSQKRCPARGETEAHN